MSKTTRWIIFLIMILGIASLACQTIMGPDENEATTASSTETSADDNATDNVETPDTTTDTTTDSPTTEQPAESSDNTSNAGPGQTFNFRRANAALEEISSYRAVITLNTGTGDDTGETFNMEMELLVTTNPPATSFTFSGLDLGLGEGAGDFDLGDLGGMTVVQVDGQTYTNLPGLGCTATEGTDDTMTEGMITRPDQLFEDLNSEGVSLVEEGVVVNGISTNHYHFDESAIQDADASISTVTGDIYVAREGEFIVKFVIDGQGSMGGFGEEAAAGFDTFHMEFNVFDVNSNITITAPADCALVGGDGIDSEGGEGGSGDVSGQYPMLSDASELTTFAGIVTYKTSTSIADAAAFYRDELTAQGWTVSFEYSDDTTALVTLEKDGNTLTVTVTNDPSSGMNLVSLIEG